MGIFTGRTVYAGKWNVKSTESFSAEDAAQVSRAEVVPSQYGMSVCFFMKSGGQIYIPVSTDSDVNVGEIVDLSKAQVVTLGKQGEDDIERIKVNK